MTVQAKHVDDVQVKKALFVLKCKGSDLSKAVRDMIADYAKEFDKKYGKEN